MTAQEKMLGYPRLYRRGAVYYHRAAVPKDIVETYGKVEETFSLGTKDRAEALIKVRIAAAQVDERFAAQRRSDGAGLLFPELPLDASGYRSGELSKFFSRYLDRIEAKTEKTSFHSLRHNFEDACRNGEVPPHIMNALQGHGEQGMAGRYGDGRYRLETLKAAVDRVMYQGLDIGGTKNLV